MAQVKKGTRVKVTYTGKLKDGSVFESNIGQDPLEFTVGKKKVIKGFETAVIGMSLGQTKTVTLKPADAYGARDPHLVWEVEMSELPSGGTAEPGQELAFVRPDGTEIAGVVSAVNGNKVSIDGNHPLAGKNLTFEFKLVGIK